MQLRVDFLTEEKLWLQKNRNFTYFYYISEIIIKCYYRIWEIQKIILHCTFNVAEVTASPNSFIALHV